MELSFACAASFFIIIAVDILTCFNFLPFTVQVRFMWYAGEELGLLGSEHYVTTLNDTDVGIYVGSRAGSQVQFLRLVSLPLPHSIIHLRFPLSFSRQPQAVQNISCMLNFDMIGSPNFYRGMTIQSPFSTCTE